MAGSVLTFKEIRDEVLNWLDEAGATGTSLTNVNNAINEAHRRRLTAEPWPFMIWDTAETFTLTAADQLYTLHHLFHRSFYFFNRTKKDYLKEVSAKYLSPSGARWNTDSDGNKYVLWGRTPVSEQPASASTVSIVSTSALDNTAARAITIRGLTSSGLESETITPTGTTTAAGAKSFTKILGVTKGATWVGTLTVTAGATTLLTLLSTEMGRSHQLLFLLGSPTTADTIEYRFYRLPSRLVDDNDITDIPPGHEQILVWDSLLAMGAYDNRLDGGRLEEWRKRQTDADQAFRAAFSEIQGVDAHSRYVIDNDASPSGDNPVIWLS